MMTKTTILALIGAILVNALIIGLVGLLSRVVS